MWRKLIIVAAVAVAALDSTSAGAYSITAPGLGGLPPGPPPGGSIARPHLPPAARPGGIPGGHPPGGAHVWHHHRVWHGPTFGFGVGVPSSYDYPYDEGGCQLVRQRVKTRHGWRVRTVQTCP